jgi:hypothetical protein
VSFQSPAGKGDLPLVVGDFMGALRQEAAQLSVVFEERDQHPGLRLPLNRVASGGRALERPGKRRERDHAESQRDGLRLGKHEKGPGGNAPELRTETVTIRGTAAPTVAI